MNDLSSPAVTWDTNADVQKLRVSILLVMLYTWKIRIGAIKLFTRHILAHKQRYWSQISDSLATLKNKNRCYLLIFGKNKRILLDKNILNIPLVYIYYLLLNAFLNKLFTRYIFCIQEIERFIHYIFDSERIRIKIHHCWSFNGFLNSLKL